MRIKIAINLGITLTLMLSLSTALAANTFWRWRPPADNKISELQCTDGEIPKFNSGQWVCAADEDNTQAICDLFQVTAIPNPSFCPGCAAGDRYEDQANGTVLDCNTNLVWLKDASCGDLAGTNAAGQAIGHNVNAVAAALSDGTCGLTDGSAAGEWRLPEIDEFCSAFAGSFLNPCPSGAASDSLVNSNFNNPTVSNTAGDGQWSEGNPFVGVQSSFYWSATELDAISAW